MRSRLVDLTLARQQATPKGRQPVLAMVIHEAALHYAVGGPEVMQVQFRHLAEASENSPEVEIQILPSQGGHTPSAAVPRRSCGSPTLLLSATFT
jgi:hypothetical protein